MKVRKGVCAVRIGIDHWLMPEPAALRVFTALRGARRVAQKFSGGRLSWSLCDEGEYPNAIEIIAVEPRDIVEPSRPTVKMIEGSKT